MNKLLPYSDIEILAAVAKRKALNFKIQQEEINDKKLAFDEFISSTLEDAKIGKEILSDFVSRDILYQGLANKFKYNRSNKSKLKIQELKREAVEIIPEHIGSEKWQTGDCKCVLYRLYDKNDPTICQTFHCDPCSDHEDLTIEELHHTINEETNRRGEIHQFLLDNFKDKVTDNDQLNISFDWEGKAKERVLKIKSKNSLFSEEEKDQILRFSEKFNSKKEENLRTLNFIKKVKID